MKALVAATCVAVLAAVGYYFVGEIRAHSAKSERLERIEGARAELFKFANAAPGDDDKVKQYCSYIRDHNKTDKSEYSRQLETNCRSLGYL